METVSKRLRSALRRVDAFDDLTNSEMTALQKAMSEAKFAQGEVVFEQGDAADTFYVVVGGGGEVVRTDEAGERCVLATLKIGSCFGERALLRQESRCAHGGMAYHTRSKLEHSSLMSPLQSTQPAPSRFNCLPPSIPPPLRYAAVVATAKEGLQTMCISRESFEAVLGPLQDRQAHNRDFKTRSSHLNTPVQSSLVLACSPARYAGWRTDMTALTHDRAHASQFTWRGSVLRPWPPL